MQKSIQKTRRELDAAILQLYEPKKVLGNGAYGYVWRVVDRITHKQLALKKIFDAFNNDIDAQRTYREITVLHELDHYNIIKLHRVIKAKNNKDLYLVFDYVEADLQSLVGQQILQDVHIRFVIFQCLRALKYLHSAQLIHRDLKPSNILINSQCQIKLCDFGLVRSLTHEEQEKMVLSEEVATRWYRSPQMLLGSNTYGKQTDVWSIGCILAELLMGEPIFPGDSTLNQLERILQFTGVPSKHNIDSIQSDAAESLINQLTINRKSFQQYFKKASKQVVQLVTRMLEFNPKKRITVEQALQLPLFEEFRTQKGHEDICTKFIVPQIDDNQRLSLQAYRKMIYCDIQRRYPEVALINGDSFDRSSDKQNKRLIRSHHSLNRKKSTENPKVLNYSVHCNKKEESSSSFHNGDNLDKIRKMKKEWKKEAHPYQSQNESTGQGHHLGNAQKINKIDSFYRAQPKSLMRKDSSKLLTKVRSRKILCKSIKNDVSQVPRTLEKKRLLR